jgi:hypothetical protein
MIEADRTLERAPGGKVPRERATFGPALGAVPTRWPNDRYDDLVNPTSSSIRPRIAAVMPIGHH